MYGWFTLVYAGRIHCDVLSDRSPAYGYVRMRDMDETTGSAAGHAQPWTKDSSGGGECARSRQPAPTRMALSSLLAAAAVSRVLFRLTLACVFCRPLWFRRSRSIILNLPAASCHSGKGALRSEAVRVGWVWLSPAGGGMDAERTFVISFAPHGRLLRFGRGQPAQRGGIIHTLPAPPKVITAAPCCWRNSSEMAARGQERGLPAVRHRLDFPLQRRIARLRAGRPSLRPSLRHRHVCQ